MNLRQHKLLSIGVSVLFPWGCAAPTELRQPLAQSGAAPDSKGRQIHQSAPQPEDPTHRDTDASATGTAGAVSSPWTLFEETSITGKISGSIRKGHIFKTRSGHVYEVVDYVYLYEYEYTPDVVVLSDGTQYKLIIEGFDEPLMCKCLTCKQESPDSSTPPNVVESYIISDFDGLDHGNVYKLANGQIWEQTEYWIWVWVWVNPKALIWNDGGTYKMKVEGIDRPVVVRRMKK